MNINTEKDINGKELSDTILEELRVKIAKENIQAKMAVILVGDNKASERYVRKKSEAAKRVGIECELIRFHARVKEKKLLEKIEKLNIDNSMNGYIVQLPLPEHVDKNRIINAINPIKDIDGFHKINQDKVRIGDASGLIPCTPLGVMNMLEKKNIEIAYKKATVIGTSDIVGKPLSYLLQHAGAEVKSCNKSTSEDDKKLWIKEADILVSAAGQRNLVTKDMIKPGAIVIDVGINFDEKGKMCGDVDYENVKTIARKITPVPGGVGPMTVAMLLKNTLKAYELQKEQ